MKVNINRTLSYMHTIDIISAWVLYILYTQATYRALQGKVQLTTTLLCGVYKKEWWSDEIRQAPCPSKPSVTRSRRAKRPRWHLVVSVAESSWTEVYSVRGSVDCGITLTASPLPRTDDSTEWPWVQPLEVRQVSRHIFGHSRDPLNVKSKKLHHI